MSGLDLLDRWTEILCWVQLNSAEFSEIQTNPARTSLTGIPAENVAEYFQPGDYACKC